MFLTPAETVELTGYKRGADQRAWLDRNAVPYFVARNGRPVVYRATLEGRDPVDDLPPIKIPDPFTLQDYVESKDTIRARRIRWVPAAGPSAPGIYFLFFRFALVYVGQSVNIAARVRAHRMNAIDRRSRVIPFTRFSWIEAPREHLDEVEVFYIHRDAPPLNIADNINSRHVWRCETRPLPRRK